MYLIYICNTSVCIYTHLHTGGDQKIYTLDLKKMFSSFVISI